MKKSTVPGQEKKLGNGKDGFERVYFRDGKMLKTAIGLNGFIVSAYPSEDKKGVKL